MKFQCLTCGGIYEDSGEDGEIYYHACPQGKIEGSIDDGTRKFVPFDQRRDENIDLKNSGKIKSEGKGRIPVEEKI